MKAILLIDDMPKNCDECPLERWGIDGWNCTPMNQVIEDDKPEWCPLKPLNKIVKVADRNLIIYERKWLYKHLEEEFELQKKVRDFNESHSSD